MSNVWSCPFCGANRNHFNTERNVLVCDTCGNEVQTEFEAGLQLKYEKDIALARQHLKVGNWNDAKRIISPYCVTRPADRLIYLLLLDAVTKQYTDYLLDNSPAKKEAAGYWDKLERLGCVNNVMIDYSNARIDHMERVKSVNARIMMFCIVLSSIVSLVDLCMIMAGTSGSLIFFLLSALGWYMSYRYYNKIKDKSSGLICNEEYSLTNPFMY